MNRWALLSVYDKNNIFNFANSLKELGFEIFASSGTHTYLKSKDFVVKPLNELTGFDDYFDGRVKTLHPKIFAPILARDTDEDLKFLSEMELSPFEVVAVNLYPFIEKVKVGETGFKSAVEEIDIGGVALLRAAAKASERCYTVLDSDDYPLVIKALKGEENPVDMRLYLASKVFAYTSIYDSYIAQYFQELSRKMGELPEISARSYIKKRELRYGENPHQKAGVYSDLGRENGGIIIGGEQISGKEVSYNNVVDMESAYRLVQDFTEPSCAYIKHTNPCGCAVGDDLLEVVRNARAGDPISSFGGIVSLNREVDERVAKEIVGPKGFLEAIIAPDFTSDAIDVLIKRKGWGKKLIIFKAGEETGERLYYKDIDGGVLITEYDDTVYISDDLRVVTKKGPDEEQFKDMKFAFTLVKHIKSNAIVIVRDGMLIGMGSGQPNRLTSVRIAIDQAESFHDGAYTGVLASDAFFPMPDAPEMAVEAGVEAIIQPGGSKRDDDVIRAMDKKGISMVFTGMRHFLH